METWYHHRMETSNNGHKAKFEDPMLLRDHGEFSMWEGRICKKKHSKKFAQTDL